MFLCMDKILVVLRCIYEYTELSTSEDNQFVDQRRVTGNLKQTVFYSELCSLFGFTDFVYFYGTGSAAR